MIAIPIYVTDMIELEAVTMHVAFDNSQLQFVDCTFHPDFTSNMVYACHNGVVGFCWYNLDPQNLTAGKLAIIY